MSTNITTPKKNFFKKMSAEYENRGLTSVCVENEQIAALHTENNRQRTLNESLQRDVEAQSKQLNRSEDLRKTLETEIAN